MFGPIKKAYRYFRREYPDSSMGATIGLTIGAGIGTAVTLGAGAPLFVIPLVAAGTTGIGSIVTMGEWDRTSSNSVDLNGFKLVGHKRDLNHLIMAQKLIERKTAKLKHLPELPAKLHKQLMAHIEDVQDALTRVRVYRGWGGEQTNEFSFHRDFYDARGSLTEQKLATLRFEPLKDGAATKTEVIDNRAPKPAPVPAPQPSPAIGAEFGQLAKKVEAVVKRVDQLENPPEVKLDKPKLKPRNG